MARTAWRTAKPFIPLAILLAAGILFRAPLLRAAGAVVRPIASAGTWVAEGIVSVISGRQGAQIGELEARVNALATDRAKIDALEQENEELRSLVSFEKRSRYQALPASAILRDGVDPPVRLVLDRGANEGVTAGAAVVAGDGLFVGKVLSVSSETCTVALASAPGEKAAATLLNLTRTIGLAEGGRGALLQMRFIPHDQAVAVNDLVVTSGLEDHVPGGLVIGIVNAVKNDATSPFQEAVVEPLADPKRFSVFSILLDKASL
jgi:rod shape-determining protein MreC